MSRPFEFSYEESALFLIQQILKTISLHKFGASYRYCQHLAELAKYVAIYEERNM